MEPKDVLPSEAEASRMLDMSECVSLNVVPLRIVAICRHWKMKIAKSIVLFLKAPMFSAVTSKDVATASMDPYANASRKSHRSGFPPAQPTTKRHHRSQFSKSE